MLKCKPKNCMFTFFTHSVNICIYILLGGIIVKKLIALYIISIFAVLFSITVSAAYALQAGSESNSTSSFVFLQSNSSCVASDFDIFTNSNRNSKYKWNDFSGISSENSLSFISFSGPNPGNDIGNIFTSGNADDKSLQENIFTQSTKAYQEDMLKWLKQTNQAYAVRIINNVKYYFINRDMFSKDLTQSDIMSLILEYENK